MEDSLVALRLKSLINALGLTDSQFADRCSISRPTLSLLLSGKNKKISDVMLTQIHNAFPEVSILWLLFGEGEQFKNNESESKKSSPEVDENEIFRSPIEGTNEELNLVNLTQLEKVIQSVVNKSFESSFQELEIIMQKSRSEHLPRKVNKITVYYDDSTFESFVPEIKTKF